MTLSGAVSEIVSFFLCCPPERKPSLNKAFFFIEKGGFTDPDLKDDFNTARSAATLKIAWRERASTGPFWWAAAVTRFELWEALPEESNSFKRVDKMLKKPAKLIKFLGVSKFVQDRLLSIIDPESRRRLSVKFPKDLPVVECEFTPFDQRQLEILGRYRAPVPTY